MPTNLTATGRPVAKMTARGRRPSTSKKRTSKGSADRSKSVARQVNQAIDRAISRGFGGKIRFASIDTEDALIIGMHLAKAREMFTVADPGERNPTGSNQHTPKPETETLSTVDRVSGSQSARGFSGWLKVNVSRLNRATAIRYADAFLSLRLPTDSRRSRVRAELNHLCGEAAAAAAPAPTLVGMAIAGRNTQPPEA